jgi:hypothetical protein
MSNISNSIGQSANLPIKIKNKIKKQSKTIYRSANRPIEKQINNLPIYLSPNRPIKIKNKIKKQSKNNLPISQSANLPIKKKKRKQSANRPIKKQSTNQPICQSANQEKEKKTINRSEIIHQSAYRPIYRLRNLTNKSNTWWWTIFYFANLIFS